MDCLLMIYFKNINISEREWSNLTMDRSMY